MKEQKLSKIQILHLEDHLFDRVWTNDILRESDLFFELTQVDCREKYCAAIEDKDFDIILSDHTLPCFDGFSALELAREKCPLTPFVFLTGTMEEELAVKALKNGAADYVLKNNIIRLVPSIKRNIREAIGKKALLQQNRQLKKEIKERKIQETLALQAKQEWERTIDALPDMIAIIDTEHNIVRMNKTMIDRIGKPYEELVGTKCSFCVHGTDPVPDYCPHTKLLRDGKIHRTEIHEERLGGFCEITVTPYFDPDGSLIGSVHIARDINEQKKAMLEKEKLNSQLLHAQKLESVGQLAAGIAHEINTPTQFVGTNIDFLDDASQDMTVFVEQMKKIAKQAPQEVASSILTALEEMDWNYLTEEMPLAIAQSRDGIRRVSSIVRAMKEFSHPGSKAKEASNLNQIVNTTLTVARNEWKYVADMQLDLDPELPKIPLLSNEMSQVILNMLVNAAHAIGEKLGENPEGNKGEITITTRRTENCVELRIRDSGNGIPQKARNRIFDPFYTTKKAGKGTGQGLAISHDVVVNKHGGTIDVSTESGKGTEFIIQLPL